MFAWISLRRAGRICSAATAGIGCILMLLFSESCKKGAAESLTLFLNVLLPSLFPFMAATGLTVKCGLCQQLGKKLRKPTRRLFGWDGMLAPILVLSLLGGYPVGARAIASLHQSGQIDTAQAKRAAYCCVCAGPGFLLGYVGSMYGGTATGAILFAAQAVSVLILGIASRMFTGKHSCSDTESAAVPPLPFGDALVEAAQDAARGMVCIGSLVVLFGAFGGILTDIVPQQNVRRYLLSALEVCSAVNLLGDRPITYCAFATGFGGICVHFQIFAVLKSLRINKAVFFLVRILQGFLTAILSHIGLRLFARETEVFSTASVGQADFFGGSVLSGAALLTVTVCFLFSLRQQHGR